MSLQCSSHGDAKTTKEVVSACVQTKLTTREVIETDLNRHLPLYMAFIYTRMPHSCVKGIPRNTGHILFRCGAS